jgi:hypothetical protein
MMQRITSSGRQSITVPLPSTDASDNYAEAGAPVELKAGHIDVQVSGTDVGIVNIDQLKLISLGIS